MALIYQVLQIRGMERYRRTYRSDEWPVGREPVAMCDCPGGHATEELARRCPKAQVADMDPCVGCGQDHPPTEPCPDGTRWRTAEVTCTLCGDSHVSVWPTSIVDEHRQECFNCGHMTCGPHGKPDESGVMP